MVFKYDKKAKEKWNCLKMLGDGLEILGPKMRKRRTSVNTIFVNYFNRKIVQLQALLSLIYRFNIKYYTFLNHLQSCYHLVCIEDDELSCGT